jgi:hypothetical protein
MQKNGLTWTGTAKAYRELYEEAIR